MNTLNRPGVLPAFLFVMMASLAFTYHMANGEAPGSGLAFFLMTVPWGWILPDAVTSSEQWSTYVYPVSWLMIVANSIVIGIACNRASYLRQKRVRPERC